MGSVFFAEYTYTGIRRCIGSEHALIQVHHPGIPDTYIRLNGHRFRQRIFFSVVILPDHT